MSKTSPEVLQQIRQLCEQGLSSKEIGPIVGKSQKAIQKLFVKYHLPHLPQGGPTRQRNGSWNGGRVTDKDGYMLVLTPTHPYANSGGYVREHRLMMEKHLGRYLLPSEVVHHIDKDKLNNDPSNLKLFSENSEHLKAELTGHVPKWSEEGIKKLKQVWITPKKLLEDEIHRRQEFGSRLILKRKRAPNGRLL